MEVGKVDRRLVIALSCEWNWLGLLRWSLIDDAM